MLPDFGIRVYTTGVGTKGLAPYPFQTAFGIQYQDVEVKIDEITFLQDIATLTNGKYFRATNNNSLKEIYKDIDELEKSQNSNFKFSQKNQKNTYLLLFWDLFSMYSVFT